MSLFPKDPVSENHGSLISGLSTTFRTGAAHGLQQGAIVQNVAALHVVIRRPRPSTNVEETVASVSEQIATLRRLLFGFEPKETETGRWFNQAIQGGNASSVFYDILYNYPTDGEAEVPLVIEVGSADIMVTLLNLKAEAEERWGTSMHMVFSGASEAHLLAKEIGTPMFIYTTTYLMMLLVVR